jgi:LCP family protein required for cell wall assembly
VVPDAATGTAPTTGVDPATVEPQTVSLQPSPTALPELDDPVNILLLGTDARMGEEIGRTDAIILVHLNPRARQVSLLSFPRDLWVDIPGFSKGRINSVYAIGERRMGPGYGAALLKETVEQLVGIPVNYFVLVNFEGFKTIIDEIGGITIDVPKAINDKAFPVDEYPGDLRTMAVSFEPGSQTMDGTRALIYARTRHADSDFGRNQRQQQVLLGIFNKIREQGVMAHLTQLDEYTAAMRDYLRTDIPRDEMIRLAQVGARLDTGNIQRYAIDPSAIITLDSPDAFAADPTALRRIVEQMTAGVAGR